MRRAHVVLSVFGLAAPMSRASADSSVAVEAMAGAMDLVMDGGGSAATHIVKVATVLIWGDGPGGFTLTVGSGGLTKTGGAAVPFQVALVAHESGAPASSAFTIPSGALYTFTTGPGTFSKDLYIKYRSAALQDPGEYGASIELDVVDN